MASFSSFAELIQQAFFYLTPAQAAQLANTLENTVVDGTNVTYGELFALTMSDSATYIDPTKGVQAANVYYNGSVSAGNGNNISSQLLAEYFASNSDGAYATIGQTTLGEGISTLVENDVFENAVPIINEFFAENGIVNKTIYDPGRSLENAFWRGGSEHFAAEGTGDAVYIGPNPSAGSSFILNEATNITTGINTLSPEQVAAMTPAQLGQAASETQIVSPSGLEFDPTATTQANEFEFGSDVSGDIPVEDILASTPNVDPALLDKLETVDPTTFTLNADEGEFPTSLGSVLGETVGIVGKTAGVLGGALILSDIIGSTATALGQAESGNAAGAAYTITTMEGRVEGGLYGAEVLGEAGAELGAVFGPVGAAAGGVVGGLVGGFVGASIGQNGVAALWKGVSSTVQSIESSWEAQGDSDVPADITANPNGTSQITNDDPDGSSVTLNFAGPNGTGSVVSVQRNSAAGTSEITTYNPDGSASDITYSGPNGTGAVTSTTLSNAADNLSFTSQPLQISASFVINPSQITSFDFGVPASILVGQTLSISLFMNPEYQNYNRDYGGIYSANGSAEINFSPGDPLSYFVSTVNQRLYSESYTIQFYNFDRNGYHDFSIQTDDGAIQFDISGTSDVPLTGSPNQSFSLSNTSSISVIFLDDSYYGDSLTPYIFIEGEGAVSVEGTVPNTVTVSPPAGQTEELSTVLTNDEVAAQGPLQDLLLNGPGTIDATGLTTVPDLTLSDGSTLILQAATIDTDPITVDADGNINGYGTITGSFANSGTVTASGGTLELTGELSGTGTFVIAANSTLLLDGTVDPGVVIDFASNGAGTLELADPADMQGTIEGQVSGDQVVDDAPCFTTGTAIATASGDIAVEHLAMGDLVVTASGELKPIKWIGHRSMDCGKHPKSHDVWPVRVRAGSFGEGAPQRDLWLSPEHAVFAGNVLIPVRHLINGATITQEPRDAVTYWHVELERHDVILAEGLPCETYLDTGNRAMFANGQLTALHPSFARTAEQAWTHHACAPLVEDGPILAAVQEALAVRAMQIGRPVPAISSLEIEAAGQVSMVLPAGAEIIRLVSRSDRRGGDRRRLGALVRGLRIDGASVALHDDRLERGFHEVEIHGVQTVRWTNGSATLALGRSANDRMVEIDVAAVIAKTPEQRVA